MVKLALKEGRHFAESHETFIKNASNFRRCKEYQVKFPIESTQLCFLEAIKLGQIQALYGKFAKERL